MQLGPYTLRNRVFVAPMAGITDRPFRQLCRHFDAAYAVSEMLSSRPELRGSRRSRLRRDHSGESGPIAVQIAGADPQMLADAARFNVDEGAQIIDINMGCPAKKVCNVAAGSALLSNEALVAEILTAVVNAVDVPVTLKIRTGPSPQQRNAIRIARLAEAAGIQALTVHGRTRACMFRGQAEYDTMAAVKAAIRIPVIANGDIHSAEDAQRVLHHTGADAVMIGRAAQGQPWLFRSITHFLATGEHRDTPSIEEIATTTLAHLDALHDFYGEAHGARIARKHIGWTVARLPAGEAFRQQFNRLIDASEQRKALQQYFATDATSPFNTHTTSRAITPLERLAA